MPFPVYRSTTHTCVVLLCLLHTSQAADPPDIREPPSVQKPNKIPPRNYETDGTFVLPCNSTGIPTPEYTWTLNGQPVDPNQRNLVHLTEGTIEIHSASSQDEGDYQCVAANKYGKSISQVFELRRAKIGGFPADKIVKEFRGVKGQPLKIERVEINSAPRPSYTWKIVNNVDDISPRELVHTARVIEDIQGNLYFTALTMQDALGGVEFYKVEVFNHVLDNSAGGSYSRVIVEDGPDFDQPATLMYPDSKETTVVVLWGKELKLQCIFGGSPSAGIRWSGPAKRHDLQQYDTVYVVSKVTWEDEGTYTCTGTNSAGTDTATIHVDVQSIPKFTVDGKPGKRTLSEGDRVDFKCQTTDDTEPPATITWMVNVEPINVKLPGKRTEIRGNVLSIIDLKREDIKVIQCKVENEHKTLYADAPLNVLLRTELVVRPQDKMVMENDTQVTFMCNATTDPSTKVTLNWTRNGKPVQFYDDPHIVKGEGMLTIYFNKSTMEERARYAGRYGCNASNLYSSDFHEVKLDFVNKPVDPDEVVGAASKLWLIILIIVLILLLLIFFLICCICCSRNKGGSYPVDEKERANGNDPVADLDKSGFHDYIRPPITKRKDSRASLTSTVFMGSTNSLAMVGDYSEGGMSEDGSFIGMYMDDRRKLKPSYSEA